MEQLQIGVIIEGTTKVEDIIAAMLDELSMVDQPEAKAVVTKFRAELKTIPEEHLSELMDELEVEMAEFIPPYTRLGVTEGDGACYGLWPDMESIDMDLYDGELKRLEAVEDGYVGTAVDVNDHGNLTLLSIANGETKEIWAVV